MSPNEAAKPLFSFAILTDPHLDELDGRDKFMRTIEAIKNEADLAFFMLLGDINWRSSFAEFKRLLAQTGLPYHVVPGNHDALRLSEYQEAFGPLYYSFEYQQCFFITVFNSAPAVDDAQARYGEIDSQQFDWLEETLRHATSREPSYRKIFLFGHVPPLQPGSPMCPAFRMTVDQTDALYDLCVEYAIDACFYGHVHHNEAYEYQGTWHITTPSLNWNFNTCFGYDIKDWLPVNYGGYRVVHVYADEISDELRWTHRGFEPLAL